MKRRFDLAKELLIDTFACFLLMCGLMVPVNNREVQIEEQKKLEWQEAQERAVERERLAKEQEARDKAIEEEKKAKEEAEAKKKTEAEAEAKKKAEAEAEAKKKAEAEAEAKRQAEEEAKAEAQRQAEAEANQQQTNTAYNGAVLTPSAGTIQGPSGKETYYNMDMTGVIQIMRNMGNTDEYWIREDGVKMLGDYVIIAAALDIRPRGSLVNTSLGVGIVCDTGGFAYANPTQIDIAVNW